LAFDRHSVRDLRGVDFGFFAIIAGSKHLGHDQLEAR
jgi:hypothetical protein